MDTNTTDRAFLGRGWSFPPAFDAGSRQVMMLQEEKDIESSLHILLSTRIGERIMQPDFGCSLDNMLFESINLTTLTYMKDMVQHAILFYEPRITLENLEIDSSSIADGLLLIVIHYEVRTTNSRYNYVYPFYIAEGNNVKQ